MICHSYAPPSFIKSSIIPIPKGTKATLTDSDKYRSIAINSILSKVLDYIIIDNQKLALQTSDYQFGFNPIRSGGGGGFKSPPLRFFALTHLILELHYCALVTFAKK